MSSRDAAPFRALCVIAWAALLSAACTAEAPPTATAPSVAATPTATAPSEGAEPPVARSAGASAAPAPGHRELVGRFVDAINRGDADEVGATFAEGARFDSVGRIYAGRTEIMDRFLIPEVIEAGGRYTLLAVVPGGPGRVVAEYDFATGGGGREHFTYDCAVSENRFTDCVGRYVG
ncbi:nuclear transport factor 2 family protein [Streptosporangium sp. NBC_01495]|uniref:nuclear transport factor 2 family protein n=1 Tax=Streptosporangium sp. NBC_01495 TaxID=2903899 RepID=UPI002E363F79|nr:nuclear transport factor 2 family protein [Streptosporangium sp. NBC_01495]